MGWVGPVKATKAAAASVVIPAAKRLAIMSIAR